jgi:hypothetical protein
VNSWMLVMLMEGCQFSLWEVFSFVKSLGCIENSCFLLLIPYNEILPSQLMK